MKRGSQFQVLEKDPCIFNFKAGQKGYRTTFGQASVILVSTLRQQLLTERRPWIPEPVVYSKEITTWLTETWVLPLAILGKEN